MARLKGNATVRMCVYESWMAQASGEPAGSADKWDVDFSDNNDHVWQQELFLQQIWEKWTEFRYSFNKPISTYVSWLCTFLYSFLQPKTYFQNWITKVLLDYYTLDVHTHQSTKKRHPTVPHMHTWSGQGVAHLCDHVRFLRKKH